MALRRWLYGILLLFTATAGAQTVVFNCSSGWVSSLTATCGLGISGYSGPGTFQVNGTLNGNVPVLAGTQVLISLPTAVHSPLNLNYLGPSQTGYPVSATAFTSNYTFIPNGSNLSFILTNSNNNTNAPQFNAPDFASGAGCEGSIFQAFVTPWNPPNNVFALMLDEKSPLLDANGGAQGGGSASFSYSSAQIYGQGQDPCNPRDGTEAYFYFTQKISTSPVPLNQPTTTSYTAIGSALITAYSYSGGTLTLTSANQLTASQTVRIQANSGDALAALNGQTFTVLSSGLSSSQFEISESTVTGSGSSSASVGDVISATVTYTGSNVTLQLYDVTAGGSCPGASCFTYTWSNVSIPSMIDGTTGYVGLGESPNAATGFPLYINTFSFTNLSSAATPTFSPSGGTYGSTQSVTISDSSSNSIICYNTTGNPSTNGIGGCQNGTLYSGAISVAKGQTIYAVAGSGTSRYGDSAVGSAAYNITGYTAAPTFSASTGAYQGNQAVILTAAHGGVICYNTTGSPATNGSTGCTTGTLYTAPVVVSSNETLYAVAGGTGFTDSNVNSAAYTISQYWGTYADSPVPPATPTFSPLPGTYTGTQNVTLASTTSGAYICYALSATPLTVLPYPDSMGACVTGTLYSTPVTVASSQYLYAVAGVPQTAYTWGGSAPSSPVAAQYTINSSAAGNASYSGAVTVSGQCSGLCL